MKWWKLPQWQLPLFVFISLLSVDLIMFVVWSYWR